MIKRIILLLDFIYSNMFLNKQVSPVKTRRSSRIFGQNLTNRPPIQLNFEKKPRKKRSNSYFSNKWLLQLPEVAPYVRDESFSINFEDCLVIENYMNKQPYINSRTRQILVGWLINVQQRLKFNHHTLYLAILLLDKYSSLCLVYQQNYQLIGTTVLFIAAKIEETKYVHIKPFLSLAPSARSEDILTVEQDVLMALNFDTSPKTVCWHLEQFSKYVNLDSYNQQLSKYILDLSIIEYQLCLKKPKLLALAIVLFVQGFEEKTSKQLPKLEGVYKYQLNEMVHLIKELFANRFHAKFEPVNQKYPSMYFEVK